MFYVLFLISTALAQLSLPATPYLPPDPSFATQQAPVNLHWSSTLGNLLWFYEAQRSGDLPTTNRVSWRNDSATLDGQDVGVDLSGGYYDAGDYRKYTFPMSFSLMSICWGAITFGKGYDASNQTVYLDDMLRWGLDWLVKAHSSSNTLYVQIGDTNLEDAYWGGDKDIPTPRPSYKIDDSHPGTDAAAQASAAFSACSALYSNIKLSSNSNPASLTNSTYAATLLSHAQQLYSFATNTTQQVYQKAVPSVGEAYASSDYRDELAIAGLFLAVASNSSETYAQATDVYSSSKLSQLITKEGSEQVFNWDSKTPGAAILGAQITKALPSLVSGSPSNVNFTSDAEAYVQIVTGGHGRGAFTDGGLLYYSGDSDEASLNPALNAAMLVAHFTTSVTDPSSANYTHQLAFTQSQLNYVLGNNPMTMPYIVGMHPNSPVNPHSASATGASPQDIANLDTVPAQERYVLYGAVVGGPDKDDKYWDMRSDWVQSEVALDYNAPLLSLVAYTIANETMASQDPWYTRLEVGSYQKVRPKGYPCDAAVRQGCKNRGFSRTGKIVMAVIVTVVGLIVVGMGSYWLFLAYRSGSGTVKA
ncbi:family 9 glycosyl hydrolase [Cristinia sonorae]|uniref:Endoglucanase n=1 Tax=Cristinia sonorae TaxID=1940300 RepID=A0A8K0UYE8_9AGAR|nr:family 9 glycosyl hydrolase [Cristinia sonorae]